jgi:hypothetical protein
MRMDTNNIHINQGLTGPVATGVLMAVSAMLNLLHFIGPVSYLFHIIASCATIGAACTTIGVGLLTIKKLRKEK